MTTSCFDTECYSNYWLCMFDTGEYFEMFPGQELDRARLLKTLESYTLISFNGINYDLPIIALAIAGCTNEQLKQASDALIVQGAKHWNLLKQWGVKPLILDHIDMIEVAPGQGSLKAYGGKIHTAKLQDLPYPPDMLIDWSHRVMLREYCRNDLTITRELFSIFPAQLALREEMGKQYGLDLRSKSDAQIAESVMKSLLPFKPIPPTIPAGTSFYYQPPDWLDFVNLEVLELLARNQFIISESGGVTMPEELRKTHIKIGASRYKMGIGGLHSTESNVQHVSDAKFVLRDHDVASYYPSLILRTGISPTQIGETFKEIYHGWYDQRMTAKHAGDKKTANSLKTALNGTFGKLGSRYSIFYAPSEMIQVTITGQLALLMLIERMEMLGVPVISANTDGIVLRCPRNMEWLADETLAWWEKQTGFETEETRYRTVFSRDVNSYIAITEDGQVKQKGCFADPLPGASGWANPTTQICTTALIEYLRSGTTPEQTIRACTDIRQFVSVRNVTGGGRFNKRPLLPKKASKYFTQSTCERLGFADYDDCLAWSQTDRSYLGKVVRWYYSIDGGHIEYKSCNLVPCSESCRPLMTLPDELPDDIDYEWYVKEVDKNINSVKLYSTS